MRKLAKKHDVSFSTMGKKAQREGWNEDRLETSNKIAAEARQKIVATAVADEADRITQIARTNNILLRCVQQAARRYEHDTDLSTSDMHKLAMTIKILQEIADTGKEPAGGPDRLIVTFGGRPGVD